MGLSRGRMTSWVVKSSVGACCRFSAMVFPVTVMMLNLTLAIALVNVLQTHLPSIMPCSIKYFKIAGVPPTLCTSSITYFPLGCRSANTGVLSAMI